MVREWECSNAYISDIIHDAVFIIDFSVIQAYNDIAVEKLFDYDGEVQQVFIPIKYFNYWNDQNI